MLLDLRLPWKRWRPERKPPPANNGTACKNIYVRGHPVALLELSQWLPGYVCSSAYRAMFAPTLKPGGSLGSRRQDDVVRPSNSNHFPATRAPRAKSKHGFQFASALNGIAKGKFERTIPFAEVLSTDEARRIGVAADAFERLDLVEQRARHWAILNQKAVKYLPGIERATTVRYEDLSMALEPFAGRVFSLAGLDWSTQSEGILRKSTTADGNEGYYQLVWNSPYAAYAWRKKTPDGASQKRVLDIAMQLPVGRMFDA